MAHAQKWLHKPQQARASAPQPSPPALNCICRASRMHQCSVHVSKKEGQGPSGSHGWPAGGKLGDWVPSPLSPMHPLATKSRAQISAWEMLKHPWLGSGAIERGGRSPLALRANPQFHPSRCSHPAKPPTVRPQLLRAGPQGSRGQVGACCRRPLCSPMGTWPLALCPSPHTAAPPQKDPISRHRPGVTVSQGVEMSAACVHWRV